MELIYADKNTSIEMKEDVVATIGMFDGVHLGHDKVLKELKREGSISKMPTVIITFKEELDFVLDKRKTGSLMTFEDKIKILSEYDLDYCLVFPFTKEFSLIKYYDFENILKEKVKVKKIVIGKDTKYGYMGEGNIKTLSKIFEVKVIDDYILDGICIHSSLIRNLLSLGEVEKANTYLGRNFSISGIVTKGSQLGQTFNVKTANIELNNNYEYLKNGVYGCFIYIDKKKYLGICNIGHNPTFNYVEKKRLEVNIFDFNSDIYETDIKVEFILFVREERKFSSENELYSQINSDIKKVKEKIIL